MPRAEDIARGLITRNKRASGGKKKGMSSKDVASYLMGALSDVNAVRRAARDAYAPAEKQAVRRKAKQVRRKYGK